MEQKRASRTHPHTDLGEASGRRVRGDEMERQWDEETERLNHTDSCISGGLGEYSKERTGLGQSSRVSDSNSERQHESNRAVQTLRQKGWQLGGKKHAWACGPPYRGW